MSRTSQLKSVKDMPTYEGLLKGALPYSSLLRIVGQTADRLGIDVYAVGGLVRDVLLHRPTTDLDFVTVGPGTGVELAQEVASVLGAGVAHVYPKFGTAAVRLAADHSEIEDDREHVLEFVAARQESYRSHSRKPEVDAGSLADDLHRRDFTVNAFAAALNTDRFGTVIDPFNGLSDLKKRRLKTPLEPSSTFEDDPLRMLRAARFAAQLGFVVESRTYAAMRDQSERIEIVSQERITEELRKLVRTSLPSFGLRILYRTQLLAEVFPEFNRLAGVEVINGRAHKDNFFHTLQVLDNVATLTADRSESETEWLRWAAICHDIGKPRTKRFSESEGWSFHGHEEVGAKMVSRIFRRLKLPLDDRMRYVKRLVQLHHRPVALVDEDVTDSAIRRLLFDAGDDIDDLMTLVRADITSKNPTRVWRYLDHFDHVEERMHRVEEQDRIRNFQPPVDGYEIMQTLDLEPGPAVGDIKDTLKEAILEGVIPNDHDAAVDYMMEIKDEIIGEYRDGG